MKESQYRENTSKVESQNGARLESKMFEEFLYFNKAVSKFLRRAHRSPEDIKYIEKRLTELESRRISAHDSFEKKIQEDVQTRKSRQALAFRLRLFSFMHKVFMGADTVVGATYKKRFNSSQNNNANIHYILDTQYITWALLREPGVDVLKQVRQAMEDVYQDPRPEGNGEVEELLKGYEQGIVGHAGVHALYAEDGKYLSAPPEPLLDAKYGIDLLAIDKEGFLHAVDELNLSDDERQKLITDVGSYRETNGGGWFQEVVKYPVLAPFVTLIQVKTHTGQKYGGSNVPVNGGYLNDTIRVTNEMLEDVTISELLKEVRPLTVKGFTKDDGNKGVFRIPTQVVFDAAKDLIRMANVLPGAQLHFVDIEINGAHRMVARRA